MSTSNRIDPPSSSLSFSSSKVSDVSKLVGEELDKVEESFEAARLAMEQVFLQINEARLKLNNLLIMQDQHHQKKLQFQSERGQRGGGVDEYQSSQTEDHLRLSLKEVNDKVSHLKSLIPSSLLVVKKKEKPPSESSSKPSSPPAPRHRPCLDAPTSPPYDNPSIDFLETLLFTQLLFMSFLVAFPENTVIKKSLLHRFIQTVGSRPNPESLLPLCFKYSIIYKVYKKGTNSVAGYRLNPLARTFLEKRLAPLGLDHHIHITGNIDNEEIIYSDPVQFPDRPSARDVIDGRRIWERSSAIWAEIDDLHLSFTSVCDNNCVTYLSLRGNSMMKELPECITKLEVLRTLDLEDCQNLVVIPSKIANLRDHLTCLDMSGCYSLVHMPPALAQLHNLRSLKGFVINTQTNNIVKEDAATTTICTLKDLARGLRELKKLNICTNVKGFPNGSDLATLDEFGALRKLTISWEGYSTTTAISSSADHSNASQGDNNNKRCKCMLKKLDLRCAPSGISYTWLTPYNFPILKKLYIIGGQLDDLRQQPPQDDEKISNGSDHHVKEDGRNIHPSRPKYLKDDEWTVQTLRLKYLYKLKIDWYEVNPFFPLAGGHLQIVDCPNLTSIPEDD